MFVLHRLVSDAWSTYIPGVASICKAIDGYSEDGQGLDSVTEKDPHDGGSLRAARRGEVSGKNKKEQKKKKRGAQEAKSIVALLS